jgi:3-phosphoglycerate kinase
LEENRLSEKLIIPCDFILLKAEEGSTETVIYDGSQNLIQEYEVIDIGAKTVD